MFSQCFLVLKFTHHWRCEQGSSKDLITNFNSLWLFCRDPASESTITYPCITHGYGKNQIFFISQMLFFSLIHPEFMEWVRRERLGHNSYPSLQYKRSNHFNVHRTAWFISFIQYYLVYICNLSLLGDHAFYNPFQFLLPSHLVPFSEQVISV